MTTFMYVKNKQFAGVVRKFRESSPIKVPDVGGPDLSRRGFTSCFAFPPAAAVTRIYVRLLHISDSLRVVERTHLV